jgi:hypothetical protein
VTQDPEYGPRRLTFFTLVMKTFAGLGGGLAGALVLVIIFLVASSILQPILGGGTMSSDLATPTGISPLFMFVLIGMVFATCLVSSLLGTLLISYTERDRYTRMTTVMGQIFIINFVIFIFTLPVYLATAGTQINLAAYAAGMQIILSATSSFLILEILHDYRYPLLAVYNITLAILSSLGVNFLLYVITGNATVLLFAALPITWVSIGFYQGAVTMFYYWIFQTWGVDYLASAASFGGDYGVSEEETEMQEEEAEIPNRPDISGSDFLKQ